MTFRAPPCILQTIETLELILGGLHVLMRPSQRKFLSRMLWFYSTLCFILVQTDLNQSSDIPRIP